MDYSCDQLHQLSDAELRTLVDNGLMIDVCYKNDMATLRYLVEVRRMPVSSKPQRDGTPLEAAAHLGQVEMIEYLVKQGANVNQTSSGGYYGPLVNAARFSTPLAVLRLLDFGADPTISSDTTEEVLFSMLPYPDILKKTLEAGADPDFESIEYDTPLDACCFGDYAKKDWSALGIRVDKDMTESMQILLDHGASPYLTLSYLYNTNFPDTPVGHMYREVLDKAHRDCTPTIEMYLAMKNRSECYTRSILKLIKRYESQGADLFAHAPWRNGYGLLQCAVEHGSEETVDYLLGKGLTWEASADYFYSAFASGSKAMVQRLLREGLSPLHPGSMWRIIDDIWRFDDALLWIPLEQGWMPEPEAEGNTVLHNLAYRKDLSQALNLFKAYVERMGLNPKAENDYGSTPYDIAEANHFHELTDYLKRRENRT